MSGIISGALDYYVMPLPFTPGPGAIGVVEAVANDVFGLEVGQKVFCDIAMSSKTISAPPDNILIGITALTPNSEPLQAIWRDGTFAEKVLYPAECLTPLGNAATLDPTVLASLNFLTIAYGGLLRGEVRPGQTLIVNGATGCLGACAVLLALAMGVAKVVAVGRDQDTLDFLVQLDPKRVVSVTASGNFAEDTEQIRTVAGGSADIVLDALGAVKSGEPTMSCINALRPRGTAVLVGGVQANLPLPYLSTMLSELTIKGAFMYPRHAPSELLQMIAAGTLDLKPIQIHSFPLDSISDAVDQAAKLKGLDFCVVVP
jgi:alcohol dehydrogenase